MNEENISAFSKNYADIYDALHESKPYSQEIELVLKLAKQHLGRSPETVLDMACGTGRHLEEFCKQGLRVQGNDISAGMLDRARRRLQDCGSKSYCLTESPMQEVKAGPGFERFDLATAFYTALGYLVDSSELDKFFRNLKLLLNDGGIFFADFWNAPRMAKDFSPTRTKAVSRGQLDAKRISNVKSVASRNALAVEFELHVSLDGKKSYETARESHLVRYHSLPEIEALLLAHDFQLLEAKPFFDEANDFGDAWNFYVCARKGRR